MTDPIFFDPTTSSSTFMWLVALLILSIGVLVIAVIRNYKVLSTVSGLTTLILAGSLLFTWLSEQRTTRIEITDNAIHSMYGSIDFKDINKVYIEESVQSEIEQQLNEQLDRTLVIEALDNEQIIVLPGKTFEIDEIKKEIDKRYRDWKTQQNAAQ